MGWANKIIGWASGNGAEVDNNNQLKVALNPNPVLAAAVQNAFVRDSATARLMRVTEEGEAYSASSRLMFQTNFNGSTIVNNQFNRQETTMVGALTGGFYRLNSGAITTTNTGAAIQTARTFNNEDGCALRIKEHIRHTNGATANKQMDYGFGQYIVAANQAGAMVEFAGFRWTQGGALQGVLEYSTGGAVTSITQNINGGVPYSDAVAREYEVLVTDNRVEFWVNNVYQTEILAPADAPGLLKGASYPIVNRLFIGTATSVAPTFDIGDVSVIKIGVEADIPIAYRQVLQGRTLAYMQQGLGAAANTATNVASGTAPTATTGSNTAATLTGLGGYYALNLAAFTAANVNVIVDSWQNPAIPIAQGALTDSRNAVITDIMIGPDVITTAATGGGAVVEWFVAYGHTAVSLATTDAVGTTAIGSKAPRIVPLPIVDNYAAAVAAGTVVPRVGEGHIQLNTPIVLHPGEFIALGYRVLQFGAAFTAGVASGGIGFAGYWD